MTASPIATLVIGPTGIGKSAYAIDLAKRCNGEIISADAYQVYKGLDIGTAKVTAEEQAQVPHHLIDCLAPNEPYSVKQFMDQCAVLITDISSRGKHPIICGGTGFYIQSFLSDIRFDDAGSQAHIRERLSQEADEIGSDALWDKLYAIDPETAERIHKNDPKRIVRALELWEISGEKPSQIRDWSQEQRDDVRIIGLRAERDVVVNRIHDRVDAMISAGLVDEVMALFTQYPDPNCLAFQGIGYKEVIQHLTGQIDHATMVETIKTKTRQFSKRQMTWFRRFLNVEWIDID